MSLLKRFMSVLGAGLLTACIVTAHAWGAAASGLHVGAAKVDITPTNFSGLTNVWGKAFTGVHDPLFVRAVVLGNGMSSAAVVAADLSEFGDTLALRTQIARELAIPADHIFITATHDHSAPRAGTRTAGVRGRERGPGAADYTQVVYRAILQALRQAKAAMQPAQVGSGAGRVDVNVNRNAYAPAGWKVGFNPAGPSDKTVWVVKFATLSGEPIALLMNYAVHSVVLGPDNLRVSGDLAGATANYVEQQLDNKAVALFTMGAAGDQNPVFNLSSDGPLPGDLPTAYKAMESQGQMIGAEVLRVEKDITRMNATPRIKAAQRTFSCATRTLAAPMPPGMSVMPAETMPIQLGLLQIDQLALTAVSGEVATNIYLHLRRASPLNNTVMMTIANDRIGYIIDDASYERPTFEVRGTPLVRGCAEDGIVNGLVEMMQADR